MKPTIKIIEEDGNIFNLLTIAKKKFRSLQIKEPDKNWNRKWESFLDEVQSAESYDEALMVFDKYFVIE